MKQAHCLICGCTDDHACVTPKGTPCHWVTVNYELGVGACSDCVQPRIESAVRPEVTQFALEMERVLQENDRKGGWGRVPFWELFDCLVDQARDLNSANLNNAEPTLIVREAVDVANLAMMIFVNTLAHHTPLSTTAPSAQNQP